MKDELREDVQRDERGDDRSKTRTAVPLMSMGIFLLLTQLLALMLVEPFESSGIKAFEDPHSMWNPVYFLVLVIAITAVILVLLKIGVMKLVYIGMLGAVAATLYYVLYGIMPHVLVVYGIATMPLIAAIILTVLLYAYPEWYVVDSVGLLLGAGVASIFGISLDVLPVILLLVILAVYDAISVYKTKHMVSLAESVIEMRIPILFVVPKSSKFSLIAVKKRSAVKKRRNEKERGGEAAETAGEVNYERISSDAFFMGLGDAIIPGVLAVSAYTFVSPLTAFFTIAGTLAGYAFLCTFAGRGKPHAGLPFLNSGAIVGFLIGFVIMIML
ncbi:hypothetical protein DRN79_00265 [Methanosarcinales archaeon]|nr:MAG: hypothetical protein DRN79_00265 [Methanosarcinales archaeon]